MSRRLRLSGGAGWAARAGVLSGCAARPAVRRRPRSGRPITAPAPLRSSRRRRVQQVAARAWPGRTATPAGGSRRAAGAVVTPRLVMSRSRKAANSAPRRPRRLSPGESRRCESGESRVESPGGESRGRAALAAQGPQTGGKPRVRNQMHVCRKAVGSSRASRRRRVEGRAVPSGVHAASRWQYAGSVDVSTSERHVGTAAGRWPGSGQD